jgi:hypothetical protein
MALRLERRKTTRFDLFEAGAIVNERQISRCVIQNLSLTGEQLHLLSECDDLPSHFLLVRGSTQLLDCHTIWSGQRTRGVIFARPLRELTG